MTAVCDRIKVCVSFEVVAWRVSEKFRIKLMDLKISEETKSEFPNACLV
jgi:hypothetical protein